jgi:hypothetical protein
MLHQKKKIIEITMMTTGCHPRVNDKRPPIATTPIEMLCLIVSGGGLVRRSSATTIFYSRNHRFAQCQH